MVCNHSRFTPAERSAWRESLERDEPLLVLVHDLPLMPACLGLIIVDEEHESSFKQYGLAAPHACDTAVWMPINTAVLSFGSATPSLDSMFNAKAGRYHLSIPFQRPPPRTMLIWSVPSSAER